VIRVISFEREYGCGAPAIAQRVADALGWKVWDQEITAEIADRLKCKAEQVHAREERCDSMFYRLVKAFMRGSFEPRVHSDDLELLDAEHLALLFEKVVTKIAEGGKAIIIGRGAPWFLRERDDAFHVFLYAPYGVKLRRLLSQGETEKDAQHLLESVDRERAAFVKKYYGKDWPDRHLYDMMLNTEIGEQAVTDSILRMLEAANQRAFASGRAGD
jgi:hypothetical protein